MAGEDANRETVERMRVEMGLDRPLVVQFFTFLTDTLQGDLGTSTRTRQPVLDEILARFPYTLILAVGATVLATVLGISLGLIAATHQYSWIDNAAIVASLAGISTPSFWLALMLVLVFSLRLDWLPALGTDTPLHYVLPIVTLGAASAGMIARLTRSAMLEVIRQDYVRTSRAKGLNERTVIMRHALRNAMIPIVTIVGLRFGGLLAGTVLVETVFNIPGLGRMMVDAVSARDYPMVQGSVLFIATGFVLVNLVVDLTYAALDPRIRYD
jgi:ABC-type dipeptide/oligopeptide/nickel transport system permease component